MSTDTVGLSVTRKIYYEEALHNMFEVIIKVLGYMMGGKLISKKGINYELYE